MFRLPLLVAFRLLNMLRLSSQFNNLLAVVVVTKKGEPKMSRKVYNKFRGSNMGAMKACKMKKSFYTWNIIILGGHASFI